MVGPGVGVGGICGFSLKDELTGGPAGEGCTCARPRGPGQTSAFWEQWEPLGRSQHRAEELGRPRRSWDLKLLYEARGHAGRSEPGSLGTRGVPALGSTENQSLTLNPSPAPSRLGDRWQAAAPL